MTLSDINLMMDLFQSETRSQTYTRKYGLFKFLPFTDEAQTALFKDPVRTAL